MNYGMKLGLLGCVFLALFLFLSLPSAQSADATVNAPIMVASQEATIPLGAKTETSSGETECPYKLRLRMGALFLHRQDNHNRVLVTNSFSSGGSEIVNARDLNLGLATGTDDSLMLQWKKFGAELRYFGALSWSESKGSITSSAGAVVQFPTPLGNTSFPADVSARYNSWLNNGEFNLHWFPIERFNIFAGVRWIRLSERLGITQDIGPGLNVANYKTTASNRLWGGQLGAEGVLFGKPDHGFSLDGSVKAGFFKNYMKAKTEITQDVGPGFFAKASNKNGTTFASEFGLNANYAFTRNIALTCRYELSWLREVALAPEQVQKLDPAIGVGGSIDRDSVLYQGGWVGLTVFF